MSNKFDFLTKELVEQAAGQVDREGIPPRRDGKDYSVQIGSKSYPYKLLVTKAAEIRKIELSHRDFSSSETNRNIFSRLTGFEIISGEDSVKYFTSEEMEVFRVNKGKGYDSLNKSEIESFESLHAKFIHLTELLKVEIEACNTKYDHKVWNSTGAGKNIKNYLFYRIYPTVEMEDLDVCLAYTFDDDFGIRVDSYGWDDRLHKRKKLIELRESNNLVQHFSIDQIISFGNFGTFVQELFDFYKTKFSPYYDKLLDMAKTKVGLITLDTTGWHENYIRQHKEDQAPLWHSKTPSGTSTTKAELRETIKRFGHYDLIYLAGNSSYKATVYDFATKDNELEKLSKEYPDLPLKTNMDQYSDETHSARIVFLYNSFEKTDPPITINNMQLLEGFSPLRMNNMSPFFMMEDDTEQQNQVEIESESNNMKSEKLALNQILFGPPGTGKTFHTVNRALEILNPDFDLSLDREVIKKEYQKYVNEGRIVFTTFHQSMNYEDFIEGIKPQEPKTEGHPVTYKVENGIFKKICFRANPSSGNIEKVIEDFKKDISEDDGKEAQRIEGKGTTFDVIYRGTNVFYVQPLASTKDKPWYPVNINNIIKYFQTDNIEGIYNPTYVREIISYLEKQRGLRKGAVSEQKEQPYILIIDEINRGNVSRIFGELITLIEKDKRLGGKEELEVQLPYSKESFGVPENLYIIGTMNTADRSVEALDTALRRRFSFEEVAPSPDIISKYGKLSTSDGVLNANGYNIDLVKLLSIINERIEILLDRDHMIGHSYFMNADDIPGLKEAFGKQIIPLLQEYFYGDYGKISLVLGEGFCTGRKVNNVSDKFAEAKDYDIDSFSEKVVYRITDPVAMDQTEFIEAIKILLKEPDLSPSSSE